MTTRPKTEQRCYRHRMREHQVYESLTTYVYHTRDVLVRTDRRSDSKVVITRVVFCVPTSLLCHQLADAAGGRVDTGDDRGACVRWTERRCHGTTRQWHPAGGRDRNSINSQPTTNCFGVVIIINIMASIYCCCSRWRMRALLHDPHCLSNKPHTRSVANIRSDYATRPPLSCSVFLASSLYCANYFICHATLVYVRLPVQVRRVVNSRRYD